jgi:hypothetical protein
MFQTDVKKKIETHILRSITFFFTYRAVYEIIWKSMVDPDRTQVTIQYGTCTLNTELQKLQVHSQTV